MNTFEATNRSTATVPAAQAEIWAALTDPALLARLTPYVKSIDVDGERWRWHLTRIPVLSTAIEPSFTVAMEFDAPDRIDFAPSPGARPEPAAVTGIYLLEPTDGGTDLAVELSVSVQLPLPRAARRPVTTSMNVVMAFMGKRFSVNLLRHLGVD